MHSVYIESAKCGYCDGVLESDASYMGRKYHKYKPHNCGQRHNSFRAKLRKGIASKNPFVVKFCKWVSNQVDAEVMIEKNIDPTLNLVLRHEFLPMIKVGKRRK